jgi:hypothetical protein
VLSQIQGHAAGLLEDLAFDDSVPEAEFETINNSLDSMVETYTDIKELIDEAIDNFRRNNLFLVRGNESTGEAWRLVQFSISGTDVWRRALIPGESAMEDIHSFIQAGFDWKNSSRYRFYAEVRGERQFLHEKMKLDDACSQGMTELMYEYGVNWTVRVIVMSPHKPSPGEAVRCIAGAGAAPPENIGGPLRFRKILNAYKADTQKLSLLSELGPDFKPDVFDIEKCNRNISLIFGG